MKLIGLTGSIATGKSFVASMFEEFKIPVFDCDREIHKLFESVKVKNFVSNNFKEAYKNEEVDKQILGKLVFADKNKRVFLENFMHNLVDKMMKNFIKQQKYRRQNFVIIDIPLLFEGKYHLLLDKVIVTNANKITQMERALARPGVTLSKFKQINDIQMKQAKKNMFADFIINTNMPKLLVKRKVKEIICKITDS